MHTLRTKFIDEGPNQNKIEDILDEVNRSILDEIASLQSSSVSSMLANEMCNTVRRVMQIILKLKSSQMSTGIVQCQLKD